MTEETGIEPGLGLLFAALAKAQGAMIAAGKDHSVGFDTREDSKGGPQRVKYSYATLAGVWESCRKPLSDNELAVIQQVQVVTGNAVTVNSILGHSSGQSIASVLTLPVIGTTAQAVGSAITYARRYTLMALVGVVTDEDDDGQSASDQKTNIQKKVTQDRKPATPVNVVDAAQEIAYPSSPETEAKIAAHAAAGETSEGNGHRPLQVKCSTKPAFMALVAQWLPRYQDKSNPTQANEFSVNAHLAKCKIGSFAHPDAWPSLCKANDEHEGAIA